MTNYHLLEDRIRNKARSKKALLLIFLWNATVFLLAGYSAITIAFQISSRLLYPSSCSCGQTPAEAIARGCKFDQFAASWVPAHCHDEKLVEEFEVIAKHLKHSPYFYDAQRNGAALDVKDVSMMASVVEIGGSSAIVNTTMNWHHTHCLYIFVKAFRLPKTKLKMEPRYAEESHALHCAKSMMGWIKRQPSSEDRTATSEVDIYA